MTLFRKQKGGDNIAYERPFKNREEVKYIIKMCNIAFGFFVILGFILALVGVISDAFNINLILESSNWLLLGILFVVSSFAPYFNSSMAKHLYGIESEIKNK